MGVKYNIPLKMFLPEAFPHAQPICYVTPTSNMIIKPGHSCVDGSGLVRSPYGDRWSYPRSNLTELAGLLSEAFGSEPPLFAKPAGYVPPPPRTSSPVRTQPPPAPPAPPGRTPLYPPPPGVERSSGGLLGSQARPTQQHHQPSQQHHQPSQQHHQPSQQHHQLSQQHHQPSQQHHQPSQKHHQPSQQQQQPSQQQQQKEASVGANPRPPPPASWAEYHQRPAPPPGVGNATGAASATSSQERGGVASGSSSPHVLAGGLSVAEGTFKARAITALSDKLRSELDVLRAQSGEEAERLLTLQAELARRREDIERSLRDMRAERGAWEHRIGGMQAATVALEEWVSENEGKVSGVGGVEGGEEGAEGVERNETDIADAAFRPEDPLSEQILEEMAKDLALEDAMDCLDEALNAKKIELEPYLELIRELSKEQFYARATTMVARKEQRERGVSQGVTF